MFSRRLKWPFPSNRLSRLLDDKRARGARVLDLTESNPTRVGLRYPAEAIGAALRTAGAAAYEPTARGLEQPAMSYYGLLDRAPMGRNEPPDEPLWLRRHDEYGKA